MKITDLINIINSSSYEDRQILIDSLYSPKVLTQTEQDNIIKDNVKKKTEVLKSLLLKHNLKVPQVISKESISLIMEDFLSDEELNEFNTLLQGGNYIEVATYFLSGY